MAKHTPGQWRINELQKDCIKGKLSIEAEDEYFIAQVDEGMYQKANALLIAAAPELLEACQRLLVCMKLANWEGDNAAIYARAAIDKATGQCLKGEE